MNAVERLKQLFPYNQFKYFLKYIPDYDIYLEIDVGEGYITHIFDSWYEDDQAIVFCKELGQQYDALGHVYSPDFKLSFDKNILCTLYPNRIFIESVSNHNISIYRRNEGQIR